MKMPPPPPDEHTHSWKRHPTKAREDPEVKEMELSLSVEFIFENKHEVNVADAKGVCCQSGILAPSQLVMVPLSFMHCLHVNSFKSS